MPESSNTRGDPRLDIHLDPREMSRLVRLDCSHAMAFEWLAHLVACRVCRDRLARCFPAESRRILDRFLLLHDRGSDVEIHPSTYDRVFERAQARAQGRRVSPSTRDASRARTMSSGSWSPV